MAYVDDPSIQTEFTAQENGHLSGAIDCIDSPTTMPSAQQYGLTFPSALLDDTNISGCAIPSPAYFGLAPSYFSPKYEAEYNRHQRLLPAEGGRDQTVRLSLNHGTLLSDQNHFK
jgi:hypothetical protein